MNEYQFEVSLIKQLSSKSIFSDTQNADSIYHFHERSWEYVPHIKNTEDLWLNFKTILENLNQSVLDFPLSETEFNQVRRQITDLRSPYEAGQFLYGMNGISQVEVDLDNGNHVFLTVFDQKQIGAGSTIYQVVNQIEREPVISGKKRRIFDVTLLINGLPIIQIEEKRDTLDINEALNQMHQYIDENQYSGIFSTVQILVAMTANNVKYMANTTSALFNKDFAFHWQRKHDNSVVRDWREFADSMLSIPMAHQMATNFMILDGTKNKQMLKVMRPYQVYATQNVLIALKQTDFSFGLNRIGYIWHTTGSGKTITSFKTAWLASKLPQIHKVVFVVDRIALTNQTNENYKAYDPDGDIDDVLRPGSVMDTRNTNDLARKLKTNDNSIIVTSVQKLDTLVKRSSFVPPDKNIVFIVDEAHRSTGGDSFAAIQKKFKRSAWVGYTGTPMFDNATNGVPTEAIFGKLLHAYTIREAIADRNVLGFKVDFETTISEEQMQEEYLPIFYRNEHQDWSEKRIQEKIKNLSQEDMDDAIEPSFYDLNYDHVKLVVEDVFRNWRNRSVNGKYNALLTTHVGGGRASTPMALMYFREFLRVNEENRLHNMPTLKVAVTFSENTSNNDSMLDTNKGLAEAIDAYNSEFGTSFDMRNVSGYTQDVTSRLNRTASDKNFLDIVIVVDQLLTGFDAPELNTLYVDRTLRNANLIQAYSRTNRIADMHDKPWGRIVNYRWPSEAEKMMNDALAIYANRKSAVLSFDDAKAKNKDDGILAKDYEDVFNEVKDTVSILKSMTKDFDALPPSEKAKEYMFDLLQKYSQGLEKLKQYVPDIVEGNVVGFNYDDPDELLRNLGMSSDDEKKLTIVLKNELLTHMAKEKRIPLYQMELRMSHVKDVRVDYDYLSSLVELLLNQVHDEEYEEADKTKDKITDFANGLEDRSLANKVTEAASAIRDGQYVSEKYPARVEDGVKVIVAASTVTQDRRIQDFRIKWGIIDIISTNEIRDFFSSHMPGVQDLDDTNRLREIIMEASETYKTLAHDETIQALSKIKYRNNLRDAMYELADDMVLNY